MNKADLRCIPGGDIIETGLVDLDSNLLSENALAVLVASPILRRHGFEVPTIHTDRQYSHLLYDLIKIRLGNGAHSYYNALVRRLISFDRCCSNRIP